MKIKLNLKKEEYKSFKTIMIWALRYLAVNNGVDVLAFYTLISLTNRANKPKVANKKGKITISLNACEGVCLVVALRQELLDEFPPFEMAVAMKILEEIRATFANEVTYIRGMYANGLWKQKNIDM